MSLNSGAACRGEGVLLENIPGLYHSFSTSPQAAMSQTGMFRYIDLLELLKY
jgi:hypothetical protein